MSVNINSINQNSSYTQQSVDINTQWSGFSDVHTHQATGDVGRLLPGFWRELHPGEKFSFRFQLGVQFMPFVTNLFHTITGTAYTYFVPYRILDPNWEEFITGGKTGQTTVKLPRFIPPLKIASGGSLVNPTKTDLVHTLWDYLGLPLQDFTDVDLSNWQSSTRDSNFLLPCAWPFLAYQKIYNDKYRFQDIENEYTMNFNVSNGVQYNYTGSEWPGVFYNNDFYPAFAHWNNDYFTRARIYQQRGVTPLVPVDPSSIGKVEWGPTLIGDSHHYTRLSKGSDARYLDISDGTDTSSTPYVTGKVSMADVSININDLAVATAIQRYNVNNARLQPRYQDQLRARFGAYPTDERLQEPEFLGSFNFDVSINQVTATATTDQGRQGDITSQAFANADGQISYEAKEHGIVMTLFTIRPTAVYSQFMPRQLLHTTRFDYITPELANTPDVAIKQAELLWPSPTSDNLAAHNNESTNFGWTDIYSEYRTSLNTVGGLLSPLLNDGLGSYTLARKFDTAPNFNAQFVQCCPDMTRILQYTNQPSFIYFARISFSSTLPLPVRSEPLSSVI